MIYRVIEANLVSGKRQGSEQLYHSEEPLKVGKLYLSLPGLRGGFLVLGEVEGASTRNAEPNRPA